MNSTFLVRALSVALLIGASAFGLSCNVNEYCLNCATGDGGPDGDANDGGDGDANDGGDPDADAEPCTNTGPEVCDGDDNDCDGQTDEGALPTVGDNCDNQMGECAGGKKQCVSGAITCTKPPMPELCDLKDNDCNGLTDEGDPGGGAVCGTSVGECVAGFNRCINGAIDCVGDVGSVNGPGQDEVCNNRDDDCDGMFDEGIGVISACTTGTNTGECNIGNLMCIGGTPTCVGAVGPTFELCDMLDQDCDGNNANGYNLAGDPQNCGACNMVCNLAHAFEGCASSMCTIAACETGWNNANGVTSDGCEYGVCNQTSTIDNTCNGMDDDCSGPGAANVDEDVVLPSNLCRTLGECGAGTIAPDADADGSTVRCGGVAGFQCNYNDPDVSVMNPGTMYSPIIDETKCDGLDNDCDGVIDEGQPNLGDNCDNGQNGVCRSSGTFQCDPSNLDGPAVCVYTTVGTTMTAETCDGLDNNCNGVTDEGATTGTIPGQEWVPIPGVAGVDIMKYEASRPDSTGTVGGSLETHVCSRPGVQPWTNIKYSSPVATEVTAVKACQSVGGRLCRESEWQAMCSQPVTPTFPVAGPTGTVGSQSDWVFIEAELATRIAGTSPVLGTWVESSTQNFSGVTAVRAMPNDNNNTPTSIANAQSQAPKLAFPMALAASTTYYVWVRMFSAASADDTVYVGISTTSPGTISGGQLITPINNQWVWVRSVGITTGAAGTYNVHVYQNEDGVYVDSIAVTRDSSVTTTVPFDERVWAFATDPKFPQPQTCNGDERDTSPTTLTIAASPTGATASGTTATFTTTAAHGLSVGSPVAIAGVGVAGYNGSWTVSEVPTATTFRVVLTTSGLAASGGGTVNAGDQDGILPTGSLANCYANGAGTSDVYDMSGNVKEWTQARSAGQNPLRGGASNNEVAGLTCQLNFTLAADAFFFPNAGFRCCRGP